MPSLFRFGSSGPMSPEEKEKPILPLSHSSPTSSRSIRSSTRRLSYTLKNRAGKHALPLIIAALLASVFLWYTYSTTPSSAIGHVATNRDKLHMYTRGQKPFHSGSNEEDRNGISYLTQDEEELIAEDDLFWQSYKEPTPQTAAEIAAEKEIQAHKEDVLEHDKQHSLSALVWWLAEGGIFPSNFEVPSKAELNTRLGSGRTVEKMLDKVDGVIEGGESIFQEGWADYAKKQYRVVVFSKTFCPFSKKAKKILDGYHLSPAPFVIELDQRSDMQTIQTLLQRLTGRRTVPNVIVDFQSIGGSDEMTLMHAEGGLQRKFEELEMLPGSRRRHSRNRKPIVAPYAPAPEVHADAPKAPIDPVVAAMQDAYPAADRAPLLAVDVTPVIPAADKLPPAPVVAPANDLLDPLAGQRALDAHQGIVIPPIRDDSASDELTALRARLAQLEKDTASDRRAGDLLPGAEQPPAAAPRRADSGLVQPQAAIAQANYPIAGLDAVTPHQMPIVPVPGMGGVDKTPIVADDATNAKVQEPEETEEERQDREDQVIKRHAQPAPVPKPIRQPTEPKRPRMDGAAAIVAAAKRRRPAGRVVG